MSLNDSLDQMVLTDILRKYHHKTAEHIFCPSTHRLFSRIDNIKKNFLLFSFETERQSMNMGGAEGEGDTESEMGSRL